MSGSTWTLTLDGAQVLAYDTIYEVTAVAYDSVNNSATDATTQELSIVSASAPTVDVLVTTDTTPIVTGTAPYPLAGGEQLDVTINGTTYQNVTITAAGTWSIDANSWLIVIAGTVVGLAVCGWRLRAGFARA